MKQLIKVLANHIENQIQFGFTNIIKIEGIDDPVIYKNICEYFVENSEIKFYAKLTKEKYEQFLKQHNETWKASLSYLHRGHNSSYSEMVSDEYLANSFVDFSGAITKWRNEAANLLDPTATVLILLLGTEAAPDKGGLEDFCIVSPKEIVIELSRNYGEWFSDVLKANDLDTEENKKALNTLYKAIFTNMNIDIFKLSEFINDLNSYQFSRIQELIDYICETLSSVWGIPCIINSKYIPKYAKLKLENAASTKIISDAISFISRSDDIPTKSKEERLRKQFHEFAISEGLDVSTPFPAEKPVFNTYTEFESCVIDFLKGKNLIDNRCRLLKVDYSIIAQILGIKSISVTGKPKVNKLTGEPVEVYANAILLANDAFCKKYHKTPTNFKFKVEKITLSNCVKSSDSIKEVFSDICCFMGGILSFFNSAKIACDELISFSYDGDIGDPFDFDNYLTLISQNKIKVSSKWGDACKLEFSLKACNSADEFVINYRWIFSPYSAWNNAFSLLNSIMHSEGESYNLPTMVVCDSIADFLNCESEDEFYVQLNQLNKTVLYEKHSERIRYWFNDTEVTAIYALVCINFKDWALKVTKHGLFNSFDEMFRLIEAYGKLMDYISGNMNSFTGNQRDNLFLFINSFIIASNKDMLKKGDVKEVIFPIYNPVMLEKLAAKLHFLLSGFKEIMDTLSWSPEKDAKFKDKMDNLIRLSAITQGTDTIISKKSIYLTCKNMWGYYGVYYDKISQENLISSSAVDSTVIAEDDDKTAMFRITPQSGIIVRNTLDYIRTFPARVDGLNIAFIAPSDMQHIVAALHAVAKDIERKGSKAIINIKIICLNSKKNSASYLRRWLDNYFDNEKLVKVNTYLRYLFTNGSNCADELRELLENHDLCFVYNILKPINIQFDKDLNITGVISREQAKFPMSFAPDAISLTPEKMRKINISQFQFLCSKAQTQAAHMVGFPNDAPGNYRVVRMVELGEIEENIIDIAHESCKWVVCIDSAVDRYMLESNKSKIIGFTTGEGSYGELNVTVSARKDILEDIKSMLKNRITDKFRNWENTDRIQKAADFCVDITKVMDGSRILKALNPYDYEIHSFLSYVLTLQMLHLDKKNNEYIVRALISLDSYKHWFRSDNGNSRPDFLLIEIPKTTDNLDSLKKLKINAKIIECKMGFRNEALLDKAREQLTKGIREMSDNWNPKNESVLHRYWLNQLYRAIIFSPLNMADNDPDYHVIQDKIFNILAGKYEIEWTGNIFAFWLDVEGYLVPEYDINYNSSLDTFMSEREIKLHSMRCCTAGQMYIQKMLLPENERNDTFEYNIIEETLPEDFKINDDLQDEPKGLSKGIPTKTEMYLSFINFLADRRKHSRQDSLLWMRKNYHMTKEELMMKYDNGHLIYETHLDLVIADFRKAELLANSEHGVFSITDFGFEVYNKLTLDIAGNKFMKFIEIVKKESTEHEENLIPRNSITALYDGEVRKSYENEDVSLSSTRRSTDWLSSQDNDNESLEELNTELVELEAALTETSPINSNAKIDETSKISTIRLLLGKDMRTQEPYYWEFGNKDLSNRHLLINGNSGCGKTYCIQTLLMEAALQGIACVVFDYTGGFTNNKLDPLFKKELQGKIEQRIVKKSKIPMNPFEMHDYLFDDDELIPEDEVDVATRIANIFKSVYKFGDQQKSAIYSAVLNGLRINGINMSFQHMADELEKIEGSAAKTVLSKIRPFIDMNPFIVDEGFSWETIRDNGGRVYVIQLSGYDRETQMLLTELLLWDIWSFSVKSGDESNPFVIVLDEAQNLSHTQESPSAKILTEGRKFGLSGWYATQFMKPQLSDDEIQRLQQASQKLYFCPPDDGVMTVAKNIDINSQNAKDWAEKLKGLKKGECVTCGNMVRNGKWSKYEPHIIRVTSLQERLGDDN